MIATADQGGSRPMGGSADVDVPRPARLGLARAVVALVHAAIFLPITVQAVYHPDRWPGPDDFTTHLRVVVPLTFDKPWAPGPPHFVWHGLVRLLSGVLPGTGYLLAAAIVSTAFCGLTGLVWFEVLRMRGTSGTRMRVRWAAVGSVVLVCMESPTTLLGWEAIRSDQFWMPLHAYHGSTGPAARPFVVGLVILFTQVASGPAHPAYRRAVRWLPAMAVLATLTKPTLTVDLVPAAVVVAFLWGRRDGRGPGEVLAPLVRRFLIPCTVIVALQYSVMAVQVPAKYQQESLVRPFEIFLEYRVYEPLFWTVLLLPLALLATFGRRLLADRYVELSAICAVLGFVALLTISTTNPDRDGLAALWFIIHPVALFLLFGTRRAAEIWRTDRRPRDAVGVAVCAALAALFVFSFLEFTSCQLGQACFT